MKKFRIPTFLLAPALCSIFLLGGCATQTVPGKTAADIRKFLTVTEPAIRPTTTAICALAIMAVNPVKRDQVKADIFKISSIVASSNGQNPAALEAAIIAQLGDTPDHRALAAQIVGVYSLAYPYIRDDSALLLKVTSDIGAGCADATRAPQAMYQEMIKNPASLTNRRFALPVRTQILYRIASLRKSVTGSP